MNIPTLVSHDLFAQVPVMFIFLRHKQWSQKNETTVAYCEFGPIQHPSYASGSRRPVTLLATDLKRSAL